MTLQIRRFEETPETITALTVELDQLLQAYEVAMKHLESIDNSCEWEPLFNNISFGDHGVNEKEITDLEDLSEMAAEMDTFETEVNRHNILSVPHEERHADIKTCGMNQMTQADTLNCNMALHCRGENYWTGSSEEFGKVFIPNNLTRLVNTYPGAIMKASMKYMGPHCRLPWRVFYIH